jgi:hypothetical protein
MFVRVQTFGTDNSADFAPASTAATNLATVTTVVNGLNTAKAGQKPGRDTSKEVLLDAIRLDLQNITRTAAAIDQTTPGFADSFRPPAQFNPNALLTTADKFIQQLTAQPALVAQFVAHENRQVVIDVINKAKELYQDAVGRGKHAIIPNDEPWNVPEIINYDH